MREVILVEDVEPQAAQLREYLESLDLSRQLDLLPTIWHINNRKALEQHLAKAASSTASIMIADLQLTSVEGFGTSDKKMIYCAKAYAADHAIGDDSGLWDWSNPRLAKYLPGAVLIQAFADSAFLHDTPRKHVCVSSNFAEETEVQAWLDVLRTRADVISSPNMSLNVVGSKVAEFIRQAFDGWPAILWSSASRPWFDGRLDDHDVSKDCEARLAQKKRTRDLLRRIFGCEPPSAWFDDDNQFERLFDSLKGLVGFHSCANGVKKQYNLFLGNLVVLIGLALRTKKVAAAAAAEVLAKVKFLSASDQLLPTSTDAIGTQKTIEYLVQQLSRFVVHRDRPGELILVDIGLTRSSFEMTLNFDCNEVSAGRPRSFAQKFADGDIEAVNNMRRVLAPEVDIRVARTTKNQTKLGFYLVGSIPRCLSR